ncbi:MAG: exodeoxyribonuclease VII small subunit [Paludibacteraceae bacterium]|nr:exodeoxyribonuclease VII small subunit [Paludibacteraceae bacterium]
MNYDKALARLQEIVSRLEQPEALSVDEYKALAKEANELLTYCREQIMGIEKEISTALA